MALWCHCSSGLLDRRAEVDDDAIQPSTPLRGYWGRLAKARRQNRHEVPGHRAVIVELGIEDRHIDTDRSAAVDARPECCLELVPAQPVGHTVVDGGHDRIVEHVGIEMDPEPVEAGPRQVLHGRGGSGAGPHGPEGCEIDHLDGRVLDALGKRPSTEGASMMTKDVPVMRSLQQSMAETRHEARLAAPRLPRSPPGHRGARTRPPAAR